MSPCGAVEIPLRYMVPTMGSAPRSSSKLTSSKLPAHEQPPIELQHTQHFTRKRKRKSLFFFLPLDHIILYRGSSASDHTESQMLCWAAYSPTQTASGDGFEKEPVCLYLQRLPAAAGSLCSSPSRPAGIPPR